MNEHYNVIYGKYWHFDQFYIGVRYVDSKTDFSRWLHPAIPQSWSICIQAHWQYYIALVFSMHHIRRMLENSICTMSSCRLLKGFWCCQPCHFAVQAKSTGITIICIQLDCVMSCLSYRGQTCSAAVCSIVDSVLSDICTVNRSIIIQGSGLEPTLYLVMESDFHPKSPLRSQLVGKICWWFIFKCGACWWI